MQKCIMNFNWFLSIFSEKKYFYNRKLFRCLELRNFTIQKSAIFLFNAKVVFVKALC